MIGVTIERHIMTFIAASVVAVVVQRRMSGDYLRLRHMSHWHSMTLFRGTNLTALFSHVIITYMTAITLALQHLHRDM